MSFVVRRVRDHVPEGLTVIWSAPQRKGKTLGGVMWAYDQFRKGRTIFSNIQLGFPHEPLQFTDIQLEDGSSRFYNGNIFIDELNFYFDGRRSLEKGNLKFGAFLLQQKKQGCHLTGTTHDVDSLDVRIRMNHDFVIYPEVFPEYPARPVVIKLRIENGPLQDRFRKTLTLDCRPFLGLYDTFAVYDPFKKEPKAEKEKPRSRARL